jgi:hypothetical protein
MCELLSRLQVLETEIYYRDPPPTGESEFTYMAGHLPVLLSAPHGAAHTRNGKIKIADRYTASFARLVAERTGAHVLYAHHKSNTDPNFDLYTPYKAYLKQVVRSARIKFVLDIHGAAPHRDFGIALGTMHGRACLPGQREIIIQTLIKYGFRHSGANLNRLDRLDLDDTFPGGEKQHTITHFVSQTLNVPAAQFELNAYLRALKPAADESGKTFHSDPPRIQRTIEAFVALVKAIAAYLAVG